MLEYVNLNKYAICANTNLNGVTSLGSCSCSSLGSGTRSASGSATTVAADAVSNCCCATAEAMASCTLLLRPNCLGLTSDMTGDLSLSVTSTGNRIDGDAGNGVRGLGLNDREPRAATVIMSVLVVACCCCCDSDDGCGSLR